MYTVVCFLLFPSLCFTNMCQCCLARVAQEFLLDPLTGALTTRRSLDREDVSQYQFLVVARDGGNTSRSTFVNVIVNIIDINDNVPVFHKDTYNVTVLEKSTPGDILQLQVMIICVILMSPMLSSTNP